MLQSFHASRSYANLAGLPYVYGLYGAFVPCIVYALFGSSRQLAVGPVAVSRAGCERLLW